VPAGPASPRPSSSSRAVASARPIASATFSRAAGETIGQTSVAGSRPRRVEARGGLDERRAARLARLVADDDADRAGQAALPGGAEGGAHDRRHGLVEVGVRHHDQRVLGAAQRLHPLAGRDAPWRRSAPSAPGRRRRPRRSRVSRIAVDRVAAAVDEVDDAGRDLLDRVDDLEISAAGAGRARRA
jgi:hypothetical protein